MKKYIYGTFFILFGAIIFQSFVPLKIMKKDGAEPGYTGSPGDSLKDCTACHGGTALPVNKWIRSNIPSTGYLPGKTYTITAINKVIGATRFGFEVSPQDLAGNLLGTMIITDTVKTKFVGGNKYITYTNDGIGSIDSMKWQFDWVAPAAGTGDVTFYGAFNSNFNHNKSNDQTFIGTLVAKEDQSNAVISVEKNNFMFTVYPNPTSEVVNISFDLKNPSNVILDIIDINGRQVALLINEKRGGFFSKKFNTETLPNGNYFVRMQVNGQTATQKLNIIH